MSIDRGDSELLHAFNRDRMHIYEGRLRDMELDIRDMCYALDMTTAKLTAATVRIRRLEAAKPPTLEDLAKQVWKTIWFRGAIIVILLSGNVSIERVTKLLSLLP
jgi:hypothetical protein